MVAMPLSISIAATVTFAAILLLLLDLIWNVLQIIKAILSPYFQSNYNEQMNLSQKYGSWALITGATDGIGKAYALELAKRGLNVVLVSRNIEKLQNTQKEIEILYRTKTKIIQADFALGKKAVDIVKDEARELPISILVNNVGKQYDYPMYLGEVAEDDLRNIININVTSVTLMCRAFIGNMKTRGRGAIVNISSGSELQPLPLMTVYAASKVYVKNFTQALQYEYGKYGLTIQHLSPMFVATKMNHFSSCIYNESLFVPSAETYAKHAVRTLGILDNTSGYWAHGIQTFFVSLPPEWIRMHVGGYLNKIFRKEYLKKKSV